MPDAPFAPIVLDPSTNSVSGPMNGLPPLPPTEPVTPTATAPIAAEPVPAPQPTSVPEPQTVPLQPVPRVAAPMSASVPTPAPVAAPVTQSAQPVQPQAQKQAAPVARQAELHKQLETLTQEESKLLGTIKDWVAWIQGAETKKQALERELEGLNAQYNLGNTATTTTPATTQVTPPVGPDRSMIEKQLREAEAKLKTVVDQQKIEEKKAFDNYSAGGINREGLLQEMERISSFYTAAMQSAKDKIAALRAQLSPATQPSTPAVTPVQTPPVVQPVAQPVPTTPTAVMTPTTTPASIPTMAPAAAAPTIQIPNPTATPNAQKIIERLRTLSAAQSGYIKQLLVDLPNQGTGLTVERAADGNGIIILAGSEQTYTLGHHFPDADLILSGLGADDIAALPTGTLTGAQITPPAQVGL